MRGRCKAIQGFHEGAGKHYLPLHEIHLALLQQRHVLQGALGCNLAVHTLKSIDLKDNRHTNSLISLSFHYHK